MTGNFIFATVRQSKNVLKRLFAGEREVIKKLKNGGATSRLRRGKPCDLNLFSELCGGHHYNALCIFNETGSASYHDFGKLFGETS